MLLLPQAPLRPPDYPYFSSIVVVVLVAYLLSSSRFNLATFRFSLFPIVVVVDVGCWIHSISTSSWSIHGSSAAW